MGSPCQLHGFFLSQEQATQAFDQTEAEVLRLEHKYSRYREDSVVTQINRAERPIEVDTETQGLLNYAKTCHEMSDGLFDITSGVLRQVWNFREPRLPTPDSVEACLKLVGFHQIRWDGQMVQLPAGMELDFGGVVKEYAADQAKKVLLSLGVEHGLVDLGGDMAVVGPKPDGAPWKVGVRNPEQPDRPIVTINLSEGAIATSGHYERYVIVDGTRYCHILNPKTGWPVQGLATVSVISSQCLVSGSLSTIAMLKGAQGPQWLSEQGVVFFAQDEAGQHFGSIEIEL